MADEQSADPIAVEPDAEPVATPPAIGVCPNCGRSLVCADDGTFRLAKAEDTQALSPDAIKSLRAQRGAVKSQQARG